MRTSFLPQGASLQDLSQRRNGSMNMKHNGSHLEAVMTDLGEKLFVSQLLPKLQKDPRLVSGLGQDAAVVDFGQSDVQLVFKIDRASAPVSISMGLSDNRAWGRLAVTSNCSDILATGGVPLAFMLCVCVPPHWKASEVESIIFGAEEYCIANGVAFAGGDTKESKTPQVIGSAIGTVHKNSALRRDGAESGQKLVAAGPIGGFMGAYLQLQYRKDASESQRQDWIEYLSNPRARWSEARYINGAGIASAAMDTSDGIFEALSVLSRNKLGISLDMRKVKFHPFAIECSETLDVPLYNLLFGGADWNIIYAIDEIHLNNLTAPDYGGELSVIGEFTNSEKIIAIDDRFTYEVVTGPVNEQFRTRIEDMGSFMEGIQKAEYFMKI